jgi:hypothetical protein
MMKKFIEIFTAFLVTPFRPHISEVLELVNEARTSLDLPLLHSLPAGNLGRTRTCPLALALGGMVGVDGICFKERQMALHVASAWQTPVRSAANEQFVVTLPATLRYFVRDFDLGAYRRLAAAR